jgi:hypothetical protein
MNRWAWRCQAAECRQFHAAPGVEDSRLEGYSALMASNLACVGLDVADPGELSRLVERADAAARPSGTFDGVRVVRWQDPSGAALVLGLRDGEAIDLLPTYASTAGGILENCHLVNESVATAAVVDAGGRQQTALRFDAEQYRQLKELDHPVAGPARITALGLSVLVYPDADAYACAPGSLVDPGSDPDEEPPPHFAERGWAWPPRLAEESFIPHSTVGDPADSSAGARLSGTVLRASHRTCALTGQGFSVATVRTVGFQADVCLPDAGHPVPPAPGNIISGTVYLTAAISDEGMASRHRRL